MRMFSKELWNVSPHMRRIAAIWVVQVCQAIQITTPLTIGVYMVRDFLGPETAESKVSLLTGVLGAMFTLSQFFTAYLWGKLSDRIGRKIVLQIGNISCMISILLLGLSPNYILACLSRFLGGLFNGVIGAEKTIIGESFSKNEQALVMGVLSFGWGMGSIVGPSFGGLLSEPCERFGGGFVGCGEGGFLRRQPFIFPCVVAAVIQMFSILFAGLFIQETNKRTTNGKGSSRVSYKQLDEEDASDENSDQEHELELVQLQREHPINSNVQDQSETIALISSSSSSQFELPSKENSEKIPIIEAKSIDDDEKHQKQPFDNYQELQKITSKNNYDKVPSNKTLSEIESDLEESENFDLDIFIPWYKIQNVRISIIGYGLIALTANILDETISIFASTPTPLGGLGIGAHTLSNPLMFSGIILMINALFIIPKVTKNLGILKSAKLSLYIGAPFIALLPICSLVAQNNTTFAIIILALNLAIRTICLSFTFTCSMIMVNSSPPQEQLGTVNGVGQTFGAFARGVGPFIGGMLWAVSLHMGVPGHQFFVFIITAILMILNALLYNRYRSPDGEEVG